MAHTEVWSSSLAMGASWFSRYWVPSTLLGERLEARTRRIPRTPRLSPARVERDPEVLNWAAEQTVKMWRTGGSTIGRLTVHMPDVGDSERVGHKWRKCVWLGGSMRGMTCLVWMGWESRRAEGAVSSRS